MAKNKKTKVESKKSKVSAEIKDKKVEDISVDIKEKIIYSKYNKFIFKTSDNNSFAKQNNLGYNLFKFGLALILAVFILISLWMTTIWQQKGTVIYADFLLEKGTLGGTLSGLGVSFGLMHQYLGGSLTADQITLMLDKNIFEFSGLNITAPIVDSIIAIGFVSLFMLIPILVFKNGTLLSVISLSIGFVLLIIIMTLFFLIINEQSELVQIVREGNYLAGLKESILPAQTIRLKEILDRIIQIVGII